MKRILLFALAFSFSFGIYAQQRLQSTSIYDYKIYGKGTVTTPINTALTGNEAVPLKNINPYTANYDATHRNANLATIGRTTYDLQSNAAIDDRLFHTGTSISAAWTYSSDLNIAAPSRGTGYNYNNGSAWGPQPTSRLEDVQRIGWPSIGVTANGAEHVISHRAGTNAFWYITRPVAGTGNWTEDSLAPTNPTLFNLWPRMAIGGNDGNSIHLLDITTPTGNNNMIPNQYLGVDGNLTYSRSEDAGVTWNVVHQTLPGTDSTLYSTGFGGDAYAIDAKGETIAVTSGSTQIDWSFWKSTDNGDTWAKTVIMEFPNPGTDWDALGAITDANGDSIPDTLITQDGKVEILVDNNGMVHAWAGRMITWDSYPDSPCVDGPNDTCGLFISLGVDGIMYWNESFDTLPPVIIAEALDLDGNDTITLADNFSRARYGNAGLTSQPSAAIDAAGNIVLSYFSFVENTTNGGIGNPQEFYSFRNNYLIGSADGGATWGDPFNVCDDSYNECAFAAVSRDIVNGCVDVIWQQDDKAGIAVQAPNTQQAYHPYTFNDIVHDCVPLTNVIVGLNEIEKAQLNINVYPNPASEYIKIDFDVENSADIRFEIVNSLGQIIDIIESSKYAAGTHILNVDVRNYNAGLYFINATIGEDNKSLKFVIN